MSLMFSAGLGDSLMSRLTGGMSTQDEGVDLPIRQRLNFVGPNITATDDAVNNRINVTVGGPAVPAPADAPYLTDGANAGLTDERNIQALTAELSWNRSASIADGSGVNTFAVTTTSTLDVTPHVTAHVLTVNPSANSISAPQAIRAVWQSSAALAFNVAPTDAGSGDGAAAVAGVMTLNFNAANGVDPGSVFESQLYVTNGTHTALHGYYAYVQADGGTVNQRLSGFATFMSLQGSTIADAFGFRPVIDASAGNVTTITGIEVPAIADGAVIGTVYGLRVRNQTAAVTGARWNLYVDSTSGGSNSSIGNFLGVGLNTAPTSTLHVFQRAATTGSPTAFTVAGGAHTTLTAGVEATDINLNLARTVEFTAGAIGTQRAIRIQAPTYAMDGAGNTITFAITTELGTAPNAGTGVTLTNAYIVRMGGATTLGPSAGGSTYRGTVISTHTVTYSGAVASAGGPPAVAGLYIGQITKAGGGAFQDGASLYILGAPIGVTTPYQIWCDGTDVSRFDGAVYIPDGAAGTPGLAFTSDPTTGAFNVGGRLAFTVAAAEMWRMTSMSDSTTGYNVVIGGNTIAATAGATVFNEDSADIDFRIESNDLSSMFVIDAGANSMGIGSAVAAGVFVNLVQPGGASGVPIALRITAGTHTGMTASTESAQVVYAAHTMTWASGAITAQREVLINAPTYDFSGGASTITTAGTLVVAGAPIAGASATITSSTAFWSYNALRAFIADYYNADAFGANLIFRKARGTSAAPGATASGDGLGNIAFQGYQATTGAFGISSAVIMARAAEAFTSTAQGTKVEIGTTPIGTAARVLALTIDDVRNLLVGSATAEAGSTDTVCVPNGTEPNAGVANQVIFYSSDNAPGNTIPSFYCEGTDVIATGQADSASSVRVRMRINGTVVVFLGI